MDAFCMYCMLECAHHGSRVSKSLQPHFHSHISVTVSQTCVTVNSNTDTLHKAQVCTQSSLHSVLHTQDVFFQFWNELFSQRSAVSTASCVGSSQGPTLVLVLLWNIECFGIGGEVLDECFRSTAAAIVPLTIIPQRMDE